ncbi:11919_t:CDS:2 [Rhizophagus irregularis]|nr:11919_t:CDS:2 [Rhizophagus irregularis]
MAFSASKSFTLLRFRERISPFYTGGEESRVLAMLLGEPVMLLGDPATLLGKLSVLAAPVGRLDRFEEYLWENVKWTRK